MSKIDEKTTVRIGNMNEFRKNPVNDFESMVTEIISFVSEKICEYGSRESGFIAQMTAPQIISSLTANLLINLASESIKEGAPFDKKMEMMMNLIERIGNMTMQGWEVLHLAKETDGVTH